MTMEKNSPSKTQRVLVEQESGTNVPVSTPAWLSLAKKAGKSGIPLTVCEQVYVRGYLEAKPHPKNSSEQQAFLRVESFIHGGKACEMDSDLLEKCVVPDGRKHMHIIKNAIKKHESRPNPLKEDWGSAVGSSIGRSLLRTVSNRGSYKSRYKERKKDRATADLEFSRDEPTIYGKVLAKKKLAKQSGEQYATNVLKRYGEKKQAHQRFINRLAGAQTTSSILDKNFAKTHGFGQDKFRQWRAQETEKHREGVVGTVRNKMDQWANRPTLTQRAGGAIKHWATNKIKEFDKWGQKKLKQGGGGNGIG